MCKGAGKRLARRLLTSQRCFNRLQTSQLIVVMMSPLRLRGQPPRRRFFEVILALFAQASFLVFSASAAPTDPHFEQKIRPLLDAYCAECHSEKIRTSGFSVSTLESVISGGNKHGKAIVEGNPAQSPLIKLLRGQLLPRMPFGKTLPEEAIASIENWVRNLRLEQTDGAGQERWSWPFEKPVRPQPPAVGQLEWSPNPIDAFILKKLNDRGLSPAPPASQRTLARRLFLDLVGMPPGPGELKAFLDDASPEAYPKLVDKLLADPRYGERWGRYWLDLVRYGETSGLEGDGPIGNAWRYRDWVIEAFNSDLPYDKFVILQLAGGDEHSKTRNNYAPDMQGHVPVAFLRLAPWDRSNLVADEVRQNYLNEVTTATASVFLGLTLGCARCHDHKYDPIPMKDFYRFQAFFNAIKADDVEVPYQDEEFRRLAEAKISQYEERLKNGPEKRELEEYEKALLPRLIAQKASDANNRGLTAEDVRLELRRKVQQVFTPAEQKRHRTLLEDADRTQDLEEKQALEEFEKALLKKLADGYASRASDPAARFQELTVGDLSAELGRSSSRTFTESEKERHRELSAKVSVIQNRLSRWKPVALSVVNVPGPPNGPGIPLTHVLIGGDYRQRGEAVEPGFPSAITGNLEPAVLETDRYRQFPTRGRRMTLAKWITSPDNPLAARVMVNRIWQHHFGQGIVETPSDFGKNGARPTHPELLDWLALKFVEEKWSVKAMHRLMLLSSAYRQSSENPAMNDNQADPDNRLLWRFNRRRLEAEAIRDSILFVSGRLSPARGGPSVFPPLPADLADFARYGRTGGEMWEASETEEDNRRRSIYSFQRRSLPLPMMASFDAPVFSESCERRSSTTTPLQALSMMNGDLVSEESIHLANRVAKQAGPDRSGQIALAFEIALNRPPKPDEVERFSRLGGSLDGICRVLLNSNEFLYIE